MLACCDTSDPQQLFDRFEEYKAKDFIRRGILREYKGILQHREYNAQVYDRTLVSMKDFVRFYVVSPTISAIHDPVACLERARIHKPQLWTPTPNILQGGTVVLSIARRDDHVNSFA
ncbi:hypothetical protein Aduo_018939 [Ancylostoma duodenale]